MTNLKTILLLFFLSILVNVSNAQYGYIITEDGSVKNGFIKYQRNFHAGHLEIELWKTKNDKAPKRYPLAGLKEYAIKKDTFRVVREFRPFEEVEHSIELIELKIINRGHLNLYETKEQLEKKSWILSRDYDLEYEFDGSYKVVNRQAAKTYIIDDHKGNFFAVDPDNFEDDLSEFLNFEKLSKEVTTKKFKYKHIPELIELYNKNY